MGFTVLVSSSYRDSPGERRGGTPYDRPPRASPASRSNGDYSPPPFERRGPPPPFLDDYPRDPIGTNKGFLCIDMIWLLWFEWHDNSR